MTRRPRRTLVLALAAGLVATALGASCTRRDDAQVYAVYSDAMRSSGRFRTETAPADAPVTRDDLARNFLKVVFEPEEQLSRFYDGRAGARRLSRWTRAPRYLLLGDGVRRSDHDAVAEIMAQLARASGLPIVEAAGAEPSMTIFVVGRDARDELARLQARADWYDASIVREWIETPNPPCFAIFETDTPDGGAISEAAIFVKAELEDPLRRACFVEEITQSLGLVFDHPEVRPSIFNDDQEFIALTMHDEALLAMLYDPRLRPGMLRPEVARALPGVIGAVAPAIAP